MNRYYSDLMWRIAPFVALMALCLSCVGLAYVFGAEFRLIIGLCIIVGVFSVLFYSFLSYRKRQLNSKLKNIYTHFTLSRYDNSKDLVTQLERLERRLLRYVEKREAVETVLRDRESFRKEFIGDLSHELKTPLFTLQGYIFTLIESGLDDPQLATKYLKRAGIGVDRLVSVVKDLDVISKLENDSTSLEKENFDIVDLSSDVIAMLDLKAGDRYIKVAFDRPYTEPILVYADELRIEQVLINLISNAIKYSAQNTTVLVKIYHAAGKVIIEVSDKGMGIESIHLPRVFERFYRVDKSRSREAGGSGLGLAIVKHIIESHREKIQVESRVGEGSKFYFSLPRAKN